MYTYDDIYCKLTLKQNFFCIHPTTSPFVAPYSKTSATFDPRSMCSSIIYTTPNCVYPHDWKKLSAHVIWICVPLVKRFNPRIWRRSRPQRIRDKLTNRNAYIIYLYSQYMFGCKRKIKWKKLKVLWYIYLHMNLCFKYTIYYTKNHPHRTRWACPHSQPHRCCAPDPDNRCASVSIGPKSDCDDTADTLQLREYTRPVRGNMRPDTPCETEPRIWDWDSKRWHWRRYAVGRCDSRASVAYFECAQDFVAMPIRLF